MATLWLGLALAGCHRGGAEVDPTVPPALPSSEAALEGWRLRGELRGPLPAWGPRVRLEVWARSDGWLRAELDLPDLEPPRHEVLIWSPEVALWVEFPSGRIRNLGERAGELELEGGAFRVEDVFWLLLGQLPGATSRFQWTHEDGQWRGRSDRVGLRAADSGAWTEVAWRTERGVQHLRAAVEERGSGGIPQRIGLTGSTLEGRAVLQWSSEFVVMMEDTVFDPLWRP